MTDIRRFVSEEDVPLEVNTDTTGNAKDDGRWKSLIDQGKGSRDLVLGIGWLNPGGVHLLHHHTGASEFYYILEGSATITSGGDVRRVRPGTAIYIPAGDQHKIVNDGDQELAVLFGYNRLDIDYVFDE